MRIPVKTLLKLLLAVFVTFSIYSFLYTHHLKPYHLETNEKVDSVYPEERHWHKSLQYTPSTDPADVSIYPNKDTTDDRILAQIDFVPESVRRQGNDGTLETKVLLFLEGLGEHPKGHQYFQEHECAVKACELTSDDGRIKEADVVVFTGTTAYTLTGPARHSGQVWVLYELESPEQIQLFSDVVHRTNWTATYRRDSTLVTPYEKYVPLNTSQLTPPLKVDYASGKKKLVAWFVSNCHTSNRRLEYVNELSRYIAVDIYGSCGQLDCPRYSERCSQMLNADYKFYLAFENANCRDYITEKFFITGLGHNVIPVVMGAPPEDYLRAAPPHSYIHTSDFESPADLAGYLHKLDKNDALYNSYFQWKGLWTYIDTLFPCRLCSLAHDVQRHGKSWYSDVGQWLQGPGICTKNHRWYTGNGFEKDMRVVR